MSRKDSKLIGLPDPDPKFRITEQGIRTIKKYLRIRNTANTTVINILHDKNFILGTIKTFTS
jgi:hypothetical protein